MNQKERVTVTKAMQDDKGLTLLEYAAGAAFVLVIATAAFAVMGASLDNLFDAFGANIDAFTADINTNTGTTPLDAVD